MIIKRLLAFLAIMLFAPAVSCSPAKDTQPDSMKQGLEESVDSTCPIPTEIQSDIEALYLRRYRQELKWCVPIETDGFESLDELKQYVASQSGWRCYGQIGDAYILINFESSFDGIFTTAEEILQFQDEQHILFSNHEVVWNTRYGGSALVYSKGNLIAAPYSAYGNMDLAKTISMSFNEASVLIKRHQAYIDHYFGRFMKEGDIDENAAFRRIREELSKAD